VPVAFATADNVAARLGRPLTDAEKGSAEFLIDSAASLVALAVDRDESWAESLNPVPKVLRLIVVEATCRALTNPNGLESFQESLGDHGHTETFRRSAEAAGLLLTQQERDLARRTVLGSGLSSMRTPPPDCEVGS
jgi:hypothetical protein